MNAKPFQNINIDDFYAWLSMLTLNFRNVLPVVSNNQAVDFSLNSAF